MFSTCLTERFSKDLVEDTLLIYPAMPKRSLKVTQVKNQSCNNPKERMLPNLLDTIPNGNLIDEEDHHSLKKSSRNWRIKG